MTTVFYGYPGRVWAVVFSALNQLSTALAATSEPATTLSLANTVLNTALNGLSVINAARTAAAWQQAAATMVGIEGLPIAVNPTDAALFLNRLSALNAAASGLAALAPPVSLSGVAANLANGVPAIPYTGVLEFFQTFAFETSPPGLTLSNLPANAAAFSTAFADIAAQISVLQSPLETYLYDLPVRFSLEGAAFAEMLSNFLAFSSESPTTLWNQLFALPSMLMDADVISSPPNTIAVQQDELIRYLIITIIKQVETFILTVNRPVAQQIALATVLTGNSLMDVAARSLGDFEQWTAIASLNKLKPPFTGTVPATGVATWGSKVLLPTPTSQPPVSFTPNYLFNFLGVDIFFGPINGAMPPWTGDFKLISGYDNLRLALGRRLQTTINDLIYHSEYGSRIPPEVGNQEVTQTANYLSAFARSCLLTDPRVSSVPSVSAQFGPNFAVIIAATVQPAGFGSTPILLNEVINSSASPAV